MQAPKGTVCKLRAPLLVRLLLAEATVQWVLLYMLTPWFLIIPLFPCISSFFRRIRISYSTFAVTYTAIHTRYCRARQMPAVHHTAAGTSGVGPRMRTLVLSPV